MDIIVPEKVIPLLKESPSQCQLLFKYFAPEEISEDLKVCKCIVELGAVFIGVKEARDFIDCIVYNMTYIIQSHPDDWLDLVIRIPDQFPAVTFDKWMGQDLLQCFADIWVKNVKFSKRKYYTALIGLWLMFEDKPPLNKVMRKCAGVRTSCLSRTVIQKLPPDLQAKLSSHLV